ncbi:MAG: hypothetical protein AAFQ37_15115, partial [Bacteroidota bacterium]
MRFLLLLGLILIVSQSGISQSNGCYLPALRDSANHQLQRGEFLIAQKTAERGLFCSRDTASIPFHLLRYRSLRNLQQLDAAEEEIELAAKFLNRYRARDYRTEILVCLAEVNSFRQDWSAFRRYAR